MKKFTYLLFSYCLLSCIFIYADTWNPNPAAPITQDSTLAASIFCSADSQSHLFLATWKDHSSSRPYYAIYDQAAKTWSPVASIAAEAKASQNITSSFDFNSGLFLATWSHQTKPIYAIYDPITDTWSAVNQIPTVIHSTNDVFSSYDSNLKVFFVTWGDLDSGNPYYATYNPSTNAWGEAAAISTSSVVLGHVYVSCGAESGVVLAIWKDATTGKPYYSVYDSQTQVWSQTIPVTTKSSVIDSVFSSYDPISNLFLATWQDAVTRYPYYATYSPVTKNWSLASAIYEAPGVNTDVFSVANSTSIFFASWKSSIGIAYYAIYYPTTSSWSKAKPISSQDERVSLQSSLVCSTCDFESNLFLAVWRKSTGQQPYYSTLTLSSHKPAPPRDFKEKIIAKLITKKRFVEFEYVHQLTWKPSKSLAVAFYLLFRNGHKIAKISALGPFQFNDRTKKRGEKYTLIAVDINGVRSKPVKASISRDFCEDKRISSKEPCYSQ